jgi:hypothetical protein
MLFTATNADPEVRESHRRVAADSRDLLLPLVARGLGLDPDTSSVEVEIAWEVLRSALQGLALWWLDRSDVPRRAVVDGAVRAVWHGLGTHSPPAGQLSATHATPLHPGDGGP